MTITVDLTDLVFSLTWCEVIFCEDAAASSSTLSLASASSWRFLLSPRISQASTREIGFRRPKRIDQ